MSKMLVGLVLAVVVVPGPNVVYRPYPRRWYW